MWRHRPGGEAGSLHEEGVSVMATVPPFYSILMKKVHHDQSLCTEGNNIEDRYKVQGTGGLPKCSRCRELG
jgi:hypothetical protein